MAQKLSKVGCLPGFWEATMLRKTSGSPTIPPAMYRAKKAAVKPLDGVDIEREGGPCREWARASASRTMRGRNTESDEELKSSPRAWRRS